MSSKPQSPPQRVVLSDGTELTAPAILIATEEPAARRLLGEPPLPSSQAPKGMLCLYFSLKHPPLRRPCLMLNGNAFGRINHVAFPSLAQPAYAPPGSTLASVNLLGCDHPTGDGWIEEVLQELEQWFGWTVQEWRHLRTYRIPYALPDQSSASIGSRPTELHWGGGIFRCGDYFETASIEGAIRSGLAAARAILKT